MRVNLGCGHAYLDGWVNVDENPSVKVDVRMNAFEFFAAHGAEVDEVFMGHFLEHLMPASAIGLLRLIRERVRPGTVVSAVVPDMRAIFAAYDDGEVTNAELNERFVYSYEQPSHHVWCYDEETLGRVFTESGYIDVESIDPLTWEPVTWKEGPESRWQCGVRATTPEPGGEPVVSGDRLERDYPEHTPVETDSTTEALLARIRVLREALDAERAPEVAPVTAGIAAPAPVATPTVSSRVERLVGRFAPQGSRTRSVLGAGRQSLHGTRSYARDLRSAWTEAAIAEQGPVRYSAWSRRHDATRLDRRIQREISERITHPVPVHVIVDATSGAARLGRTIASLEDQTWSHVRATVVGPTEVAQKVARRGNPDFAYRAGGNGEFTSVANGLVAETDDRDLVVFLRAGDRLAPDACFRVAEVVRDDPFVDLVTFDDDVLAASGGRHDPRFRPSYSPEMLLGSDALGRSFAIRAGRFVVVGGLRHETGPAQWWDLVLRCDLEPDQADRVPRVLAHLARRDEATPAEGVEVVTETLERRGLPARAVATAGVVRIEWELPASSVTVIVPTRHNREMMDRLLPGLAATEADDLEVVVVDNGGRTEEHEAYYDAWRDRLDLRVEWWDEPFNYSAVNNHGASVARGEVLVFLNDDIELPDPTWLREVVGWVTRPEIGTVGLQLLAPDGTIQHGGVILGLGGFADHLFEGMRPDSPSLLGPTTWYRNVLAVTAACVGVRRGVFEELGGFDERFVLCGSDVVLGLDAVIAGYRNVCSPFGGVRHHEGATRGHNVPAEDFFASYWRYQRWVRAGDPYFSPGLSLLSREPKLRSGRERPPDARFAEALHRPMDVFRQGSNADEAADLANACRISEDEVRALSARHGAVVGAAPPKTVNWFFPDIDSPFYGGINTALRIADHLARVHGVENRFVIWSDPNEAYFRSAFAAVFPSLADAPIHFHANSTADLESLPPCDVAIATLWTTAYSVARFPHARRGFYLIQDFEPGFYPNGALYGLTEESYRFGLYGLCNTPRLADLYRREYGGIGGSFLPAVDTSVFHAEGRVEPYPGLPTTIFVYARPGHWRNSWELAAPALVAVKERLGDQVRIVTAGSWARPEDLGSGINHLGLLDYRETGELYRHCQIGVALTLSEHPSYLPLEYMACGTTVVAFDNPAGHWLLRDGENALLTRRTVDGLADALERLVRDPQLRRTLRDQGLADIAANHASWDKALSGVYGILSDPHAAT